MKVLEVRRLCQADKCACNMNLTHRSAAATRDVQHVGFRIHGFAGSGRPASFGEICESRASSGFILSYLI